MFVDFFYNKLTIATLYRVTGTCDDREPSFMVLVLLSLFWESYVLLINSSVADFVIFFLSVDVNHILRYLYKLIYVLSCE